jgi:hypothetical protein
MIEKYNEELNNRKSVYLNKITPFIDAKLI